MFSFKSYFVFLGRNKAYTAINLIGFAVAGLVAFVIAVGAVMWQSLSAANANPVETLKK